MNTYRRSIVDASFRFIAFDLRASDNTSLSNTRPVTLLLVAEDIHTIIETLNLQDVTLVGHSQGGKDVIAYEQVYGNEYLHSLCLMDTTPCTHQEEGFGYATRFDSYTKEQSDKDIASIRENSLDFFAEITQKGSPDLTLDEAREAAKKRLAHQHLPEAVDLYESSNSLDLRPGVEAINVPTAYMYAAKGTLIHPEIYKWYAEHIKSDYYPIPFDTSMHEFHFISELVPDVTKAFIEFFKK